MNFSVQNYLITPNFQAKQRQQYSTNTSSVAFKATPVVEVTKKIAPKVAIAGTAVGALKAYLNLNEYGKTDEANSVLKHAISKFGADKIREASISVGSDLYSQGEGRVSRRLTTDVLKLAGTIPESDIPENIMPVTENIAKLKTELAELKNAKSSQQNSEKTEKLQKQLSNELRKVKKEINSLQRQLKAYGAGTDRYDQIHMDRIQAQIKSLRKFVPIDRTNLKEVLQASPEEIFTPLKADNIKGTGISFRPVIPTDPEKLKDVTYTAIPIYTNARTVEEMIRIAKRDGIKIELVKNDKGKYYPGVKNIWSDGGYFNLDRDSFVVKYGEVPISDENIDHNWAEKNKYKNKHKQWVITDCAIVASDKKTVADIMPKSYVKADGSSITKKDKCVWNGFRVHKDANGIINAAAFSEPRSLITLEGPMKEKTNVTMGDVEGNVYNKYKDLEKQILKNKIEANPEDPNSQKFIDLVKAGEKDAAIELLQKVTVA